MASTGVIIEDVYVEEPELTDVIRYIEDGIKDAIYKK